MNILIWLEEIIYKFNFTFNLTVPYNHIQRMTKNPFLYTVQVQVQVFIQSL